MDYIIMGGIGLAAYLLYRYYAGQQPAQQPAVVNLDDDNGGQPAAYQPGDNGGGGGTTPPPPPGPSAPTSTVAWQPISEGAQLQPGFVYRASAPPQNFLVMSMIPGHLASAGFTDVQIYKPGDAFPNDWPDTGSALRIQATLPAGAQPQTFALDGVSVWQQTSATHTAGQVVQQVVEHAMNRVRGVSYRKIPVPASNGVFAGLVRPPQSR